jgi:hypothetical protein
MINRSSYRFLNWNVLVDKQTTTNGRIEGGGQQLSHLGHATGCRRSKWPRWPVSALNWRQQFKQVQAKQTGNSKPKKERERRLSKYGHWPALAAGSESESDLLTERQQQKTQFTAGGACSSEGLQSARPALFVVSFWSHLWLCYYDYYAVVWGRGNDLRHNKRTLTAAQCQSGRRPPIDCQSEERRERRSG